MDPIVLPFKGLLIVIWPEFERAAVIGPFRAVSLSMRDMELALEQARDMKGTER